METSPPAPTIGQTRLRQRNGSNGEYCVMSEPADFNLKPSAPQGLADERTIAQVEKWMNMIREMSRDEKKQGQSEPHPDSKLPDLVAASIFVTK
jgi:hypothetical protein